ncbi:hypothetical protein [Effusibacillus dendaii]|uniref:Uncharacterized protein n=1 Tax=Effusibacillus dendaii TaxID=2743772 RepID=A0A7I8D540_9BACL|nr:hypothetical protein [Effusibacillus dendaii]BCJ85243.1 hypothetical protein skT53_02280 [Effusibacillus dendaii]
MIQVEMNQEQFARLPEQDTQKWGFQAKEGNRLTAAMSVEQFSAFLRDNNLIVYKQHIKDYEHGTIYGEFNLA